MPQQLRQWESQRGFDGRIVQNVSGSSHELSLMTNPPASRLVSPPLCRHLARLVQVAFVRE